MHEPTEQRIHKRRERPFEAALSIYAHMRAFLITTQFLTCGGSSCNATGRSLERQRRVRLPLSGTALLQMRSETIVPLWLRTSPLR